MSDIHGGASLGVSRKTVDTTKYKRTAAFEPLRQLCRIADFLCLLTFLRIQKRLPAFSELHAATFVELGPGPTRLASLKRLLFRKVVFIDQSDFGIPDPDLRIVDLEQFDDAEKLLTDNCELPSNQIVLFFADHCLEHLSEDTLSVLLRSVIDNGFLACFRVPNIFSPTGQRSFRNDSTHRTAFDSGFRERVRLIGLTSHPWLRWYRPRLIFDSLINRRPLMNQAEEIAVCTGRQFVTKSAANSFSSRDRKV